VSACSKRPAIFAPSFRGALHTFLERAHLVFDNESARSAEQARIAELEQVLGRMTLENEILKKASSRLASLSTRSEK
jgi:transposase-like protein